MLTTCFGTPALRIPKLRTGRFFPDDVIERYQRVSLTIVSAVAETCATSTGTRKVQRVAKAMGVERLSKDQISALAHSLDAEADELLSSQAHGNHLLLRWGGLCKMAIEALRRRPRPSNHRPHRRAVRDDPLPRPGQKAPRKDGPDVILRDALSQ